MGVFSPICVPKEWASVQRQYPFGSHRHSVENLLAVVVVRFNELIDTVDIRRHPRLSLPRFRQGKRQSVLTITLPGKRKRLPLTLGHNVLVIGEDKLISLNREDGLMNLVQTLVREIEDFWASYGH